MTGTSIRAGFAALLGGLLLAACNPPVDYGQPCQLIRPAFPDGGGIAFIPVGDPEIDPRFDFLSNGDPDCEDLVCIRQAGKDYSAMEGNGNAHGECSTACIGDSDCGDASLGLTCSQLAFDQEFLDQLRTQDPATYAEFFGDSASAHYCTDPNLPNLTGP
jgi:hypothetical protein